MASSPPVSTRTSRNRPQCTRSRRRPSMQGGRHRSCTTRSPDCEPLPTPRWSTSMARSFRVSIAPASHRADSPSMVSHGAWYSGASPAATPPNVSYDRGPQQHRTAYMTAEAVNHATVIAAGGPTEVAVGADLLLTALISCPAGCDLSGVPIEVTSPDGVTTAVEPVTSNADI